MSVQPSRMSRLRLEESSLRGRRRGERGEGRGEEVVRERWERGRGGEREREM